MPCVSRQTRRPLHRSHGCQVKLNCGDRARSPVPHRSSGGEGVTRFPPVPLTNFAATFDQEKTTLA